MQQLLYLSRRSPSLTIPAIGPLAEAARSRNAALGVTGALLFDGRHFSQYLEGPSQALDTLMADIDLDPRHEDVRLLHRGVLETPRRFAGWHMVYAVADEWQLGPGGLVTLGALEGPQAVERFMRWAPAWARPD